MTMIRRAAAALALLGTLGLSQPLLAQHAGHGAAPPAQEPASTREYRAANERMHHAMAIPFTGNADRDFAAAMIPHHQGAIDMTRAGMKGADNEESKKLAEETIQSNERELKKLTEWVEKHAQKESRDEATGSTK
jgi:uncharacterized protein (DUF305 family)